MSVATLETPSVIAAPVCPFKPDDRVRLTQAALERMCPSARGEFTGDATLVRFAPNNRNLVDIRFYGGRGSERWHVSLIEHVGSDVTAGLPPGEAEVR